MMLKLVYGNQVKPSMERNNRTLLSRSFK